MIDAELKELYQQVILDHNKSPRNFRVAEPHTHDAEGYNPLCGDQVHIYVRLKENVIDDISFMGNGCAISKSSASLMTTILKGKTTEEAETVFHQFHELVAGKSDELPDLESLGKLAVFAGIKEFPMRVKCASLAWHTYHSAVQDYGRTASTE